MLLLIHQIQRLWNDPSKRSISRNPFLSDSIVPKSQSRTKYYLPGRRLVTL
jgi:hypothetical protein